MTDNQATILKECPEYEPLEDADGGLCLNGTQAGKTISYGTCKVCLKKQGINITLTKNKPPRTTGGCKTCRGL